MQNSDDTLDRNEAKKTYWLVRFLGMVVVNHAYKLAMDLVDWGKQNLAAIHSIQELEYKLEVGPDANRLKKSVKCRVIEHSKHHFHSNGKHK